MRSANHQLFGIVDFSEELLAFDRKCFLPHGCNTVVSPEEMRLPRGESSMPFWDAEGGEPRPDNQIDKEVHHRVCGVLKSFVPCRLARYPNTEFLNDIR